MSIADRLAHAFVKATPPDKVHVTGDDIVYLTETDAIAIEVLMRSRDHLLAVVRAAEVVLDEARQSLASSAPTGMGPHMPTMPPSTARMIERTLGPALDALDALRARTEAP